MNPFVRIMRLVMMLNWFMFLYCTWFMFVHFLERGPSPITTTTDDFKGCKPHAVDFRKSFGRIIWRLNTKIHGQPLAILPAIRLIKKNFRFLSTGSPIVIELYGPSGTGKSYVCELLAESMFYDGLKSEFVNVLDGEDLHLQEEQLSLYTDELRDYLRGNLTKCKKSLFIFKHTEKIPEELFHPIQDIMLSKMGGIFLFTTTESSPIVSEIYAHLLTQGTEKRQMNFKHYERALRKPLFNIGERLLFLPMTVNELKMCAVDELAKMGDTFLTDCITESIYKRIPVDTVGYTNMTCKEIIQVTRYVVIHNNCDIQQ
ncbi:torsin-1A-like [Ischnura elegans]|uniref:torsin-1A-like n=1 Tax=Ischnura elegans TaxID=197161 RepID=UPI001ED880B3|nr:torsin-1A-like [Ischnura elegans]